MKEYVKVSNLVKKYGNKTALDGITCCFEQGKIYGLLGPNASGKTTFMKICAALLMDYKGELQIDGIKPGLATKSKVAYLPDGNLFFDWMEVKDAINYFDDFFMDFDRQKAESLLDSMELNKKDYISTLSKGMKSRLKLIVTLSRKAQLFLLDEAFDGVDPVTREKFINLILSTFTPDSTMIIATHHIDYVEKLLDEVKFLNKGAIIRESNVDDIRHKKEKSLGEYYLEVFGDVQNA